MDMNQSGYPSAFDQSSHDETSHLDRKSIPPSRAKANPCLQDVVAQATVAAM